MKLKKCPYCDSEFEGHTKDHALYQLKQHVISRHSTMEQVEFFQKLFDNLKEDDKNGKD